jgi:8-oxo-dGTP pyrophosphatase MutT (NUDIX family)
VKQAAVLVGLLGDESVLLTRRASHLSSHGGQVSFPGGRIDEGDSGPEAAALREAQEEIGLDPADVTILGRLPGHVTGTGYYVTPVIGRLRPGARMVAAVGEVAEIFSLPLSVVRDPSAPQRQRTQMRDGEWREFWVWPHPTEHIWGATASILRDLAAWLQ